MYNILLYIFGSYHAKKHKLHFEKIENSGMTCAVKIQISPKNTFSSDVMRGFCSSFKNKAEIRTLDAAIHTRIFNFLKM